MKIVYHWTLFATLLFSTATMAEANKPAVVTKSINSSTSITLTETERAIVRGEMGKFLAGLQQITLALANDDMQTVSEVATTLGPQMMRNVSRQLLKSKLPKGFMQFGRATHNSFNVIAQNAKDLGDRQLILKQLSSTLEKCVACHAAYQIKVESGQ